MVRRFLSFGRSRETFFRNLRHCSFTEQSPEPHWHAHPSAGNRGPGNCNRQPVSFGGGLLCYQTHNPRVPAAAIQDPAFPKYVQGFSVILPEDIGVSEGPAIFLVFPWPGMQAQADMPNVHFALGAAKGAHPLGTILRI